MNALATLLTYAGLAVAALAMPRHHRAVFGRDLPSPRRPALRLGAFTLPCLGLMVDWHSQGPELGVVAWCAQLSVTGLVLTLVLTFRPRWWPAPLVGLALAALL